MKVKSIVSSPLAWGLALAIVALLAGVILLGAFHGNAAGEKALSVLKGTEAYQSAIAKAKSSPFLQSSLGAPVEERLLDASIEDGGPNGSGALSMSLRLSGPKGSALLLVEGAKANGLWTYKCMDFKDEASGRSRDLLLAP